jgi:3,5-epimerase/4-reductase
MASDSIIKLKIEGAFLVTGRRHLDHRGTFEELYNETKFLPHPITDSWRQISIAESHRNVLRGIHCSNFAKYVTCLKGKVYDVIVDLRPDSPTFMEWQGVWLDCESTQPVHLYVPKRCGHAYFSAVDNSLFIYFQDGTFNPKEDIELNLFDETINIKWPEPSLNCDYIISQKDINNLRFDQVRLRLETECRGKLNIHSVIKQVTTFNGPLLIYGATGFLGKCLIEILVKQGKPFNIGTARLENRTHLINELRQFKPTQVICAAGIAGKPNVSWCETNQTETIRANIIGQLNLADVCLGLKLNDGNPIHCTLLTSGVIYTYENDGAKHSVNSGIGYTEQDTPNFDGNFYTKMRIIEERLLESYSNVLNLRVSYPTTLQSNPKSFLTKLINFDKITSIPLSLTIVDDLWPIMIEMSERKVTGTFNFNNPGVISHNEILEMYRDIVNPLHKWSVVVDLDCKRGGAHLDTTKLMAHVNSIGKTIPNVKESVRRILLKQSKWVELDQNSENLFKPKNLMITGGAGFIGSHVAVYLAEKYPQYLVVVYDILDYCSNLKNLERIKDRPNFRFIKGDICNFDMVYHVMKQFEIDCVMHFAAQSHVDFSFKVFLNFF